MQSRWSKLPITAVTASGGVAGLIARPAWRPASRTALSAECTWGVASQWTMSVSAPALANSSTRCSGRSTIRWTSSAPPRSWTRSRRDSTISGPIVIGGTKWPSITSTWITRAPASMTSSTCSPRQAKSADRIEGTTRTSCIRGLATAPHATARRRGPARSARGLRVLRAVLLLVVDLVERRHVAAQHALAVVVDLVELVGEDGVAALAAVHDVDLAVAHSEAVAARAA